MKTKQLITGITTVVSLLFFSIPCFSQAIYGCYHNKNGKLRVVSDLSLCKKAELPITWNVTGPQGPPGNPGGIMLLSANDEPLGVLLEMGGAAKVFMESLKKTMQISIENGENLQGSQINTYFTGANCTGNPFAPTPPLSYLYSVITSRNGDGTPTHYIMSPEVQSPHFLSYRNVNSPYQCGAMDQIHPANALTEVTLPFAYPVALPLKFE